MFYNFKLRNYKAVNNNENKFLKQLSYWTSTGKYGIKKEGRIWIYNSLDQWAEQLNVSKSTIQRTVRSLKERGIIDSAYLSHNKRNRTLFYSINYDKLAGLNHIPKIVKNVKYHKGNDHMVDHMYIDNNNNFNKSYKSIKNLSQKKLEDINLDEHTIVENQNPEYTNSEKVTEKPRNTTVQDMIRVFNEEFSDVSVQLDKNLAKNMVAAFKLKFENSIQKWKGFLKLIKTSNYLMSEKFKLTLKWLLKFSTIDRLNLGELGVKICNIFTNKIDDEDLQSRVEQQISEIDEEENFKTFRKQIAQKLSNAVYLNWFSKVKFEKQENEIKTIYPSKFIEDTIQVRYKDQLRYIVSEYAKC